MSEKAGNAEKEQHREYPSGEGRAEVPLQEQSQAAGKNKNEKDPVLSVGVFFPKHGALSDDIEPLDTGRMNISERVCFPMLFDGLPAEHVAQVKGKPLPDTPRSLQVDGLVMSDSIVWEREENWG